MQGCEPDSWKQPPMAILGPSISEPNSLHWHSTKLTHRNVYVKYPNVTMMAMLLWQLGWLKYPSWHWLQRFPVIRSFLQTHTPVCGSQGIPTSVPCTSHMHSRKRKTRHHLKHCLQKRKKHCFNSHVYRYRLSLYWTWKIPEHTCYSVNLHNLVYIDIVHHWYTDDWPIQRDCSCILRN